MKQIFLLEDGLLTIENGHVYDESEIQKAFYRSLRELREYAELTLRKLSELTKIPLATLSAYENETRVPALTNAMKICAFFNCTITDFIKNGLDISDGELDIFTKYDMSRNHL